MRRAQLAPTKLEAIAGKPLVRHTGHYSDLPTVA